jgi:hypothetical protein
MARQLIVHPHFLHFTTQALGSPRFRPAIPAIIGEEKGKVTVSARRTVNLLSPLQPKTLARFFGASDKLTLQCAAATA